MDQPETVEHQTSNGRAPLDPPTAQTLPGHDEPVTVNGAGPNDPFDPDAPDTPQRAEAEHAVRLALLEERVTGHAQVLALVTVGVLVLAGLLALQIIKARAQ